MRTTISVAAALVILFLVSLHATADVPQGLAKATFVVHCYTVGVNALEGKPGVISVAPGWSGAREVDRVVFDPELVSVEQLEDWLKEADTYVSTIGTMMNTEPAKEISQ